MIEGMSKVGILFRTALHEVNLPTWDNNLVFQLCNFLFNFSMISLPTRFLYLGSSIYVPRYFPNLLTILIPNLEAKIFLWSLGVLGLNHTANLFLLMYSPEILAKVHRIYAIFSLTPGVSRSGLLQGKNYDACLPFWQTNQPTEQSPCKFGTNGPKYKHPHITGPTEGK